MPANQYSTILLESDCFASSSPQKGAILSVKNSKITGNGWAGIYVSGGNGVTYGGLTSLYFSQSSAYPARAYFENSEVSGSIEGIANYAKDLDFQTLYFQNTSGGIIQARNTIFKNNTVALTFANYRNYYYGFPPIISSNTNKKHNDASFFQFCTFKYDNTSPSTPGTPTNLVQLKDVEGVSFYGCTFSDVNHVSNMAIASLNAGVKVDAGCNCPTCPASPSNPCIGGTMVATTFTGFKNSINAQNLASAHNFTIQNSTLTDAWQSGISLTGCFSGNILKNQVSLKEISGGLQPRGIALGGSTGFRVEQNEINGDNTTHTFGIVVDNSMGNNNEIYKNRVGLSGGGTGKLQYSMQANGKNFKGTSGIQVENGLRYFCNDLSSNSYVTAQDISIFPLGGVTLTGVAQTQAEIGSGTNKNPSNDFAQNKNQGYHFNNDLSNIAVQYWVDNFGHPGQVPVYNKGYVYLNPTSSSKSCPNGNYYNSPSTSDYASFATVRDNLAGQIASDDAGDCATYGYCAYAEHLNAYFRLTDDMLQHYLYPDAVYNTHIDSIAADTVYTFGDSSVIHIDSVIMVLANSTYGYGYKVWLAGIYAQLGQFDDAYDVLDAIPVDYSLSTDENDDLDNIKTILELAETLAGNDDDWSDIDGGTKSWLESQTSGGDGYSRYLARYFMARYENSWQIPEVIEETSEEKPSGLKPAYANTRDVQLAPNPVTDNLNITIQGMQGMATATVFDITGRKLLEQQVNANGTTLLNMTALKPGAYNIRLVYNKKLLMTQVIIKQ